MSTKTKQRRAPLFPRVERPYPVQTRLTEEAFTELHQLAQDRRRSLSTELRIALEQYLEREKANAEK
jgi:hypothetical protein